MEWLFALFALIGISMSGSYSIKDKKKMDSENLNLWPKKWGNNIPTADHIKAVELAVKTFPKVPEKLLFAFEKRETNCTDVKGGANGGNSKLYHDSYMRYKDSFIPGSKITWGKMFPKLTDWRPYSAWQLNPYHLVPNYVSAGAPISEMLNPYKAAMAAANLLNDLYIKHGSWFVVILKYNNNSQQYRKEVMGFYADLGGKLSELGVPNV